MTAPKLKPWIDEGAIYYRKDIKYNDKITFKQPTVGEVLDMGEREYFSVARGLVSIPSDKKSELFDVGIDWMTISDFQLFCSIAPQFSIDETRLLLGDINLQEFELCERKDNGEMVLYNSTTDCIIDRYVYQHISDYICKLHGFELKPEVAVNEMTKRVLIEVDRDDKEIAKNKPYQSILIPTISFLVNSQGFKHDEFEVREMGIYSFFDSLKRITLIKKIDQLYAGLYSGTVDQKSIKSTDVDYLRAF